MFRRVLIANRGEIAVRIAQTLQQMEITAVAFYSETDSRSLHVRAADESYSLGGKTSAESYLRIEKIIDVAKAYRIDAIHPGYGFLSENEDFAQACADAGITFIGPSPAVIRDMGDKIIAKEKFSAAGVPIIPGWAGSADDGIVSIKKHAASIGYPVLIKAAAGGGGKGMRVVPDEKELATSLEAAQREANAAFGDGRVFLEKYISRPRHVEFQIFGDIHGNVVHLFERECSIQRRHQKIIEESPSPALTPQLRQKMGEAAVRAAKAIGYTNAGTVEFMLDDSGNFYFLEVNTRLQVEHPVTEMITHQDLVRAQVQVAAGEKLPFAQEQLHQDGHAIECRIYAEDPSNRFLPSTGMLEHYVPPVGPNIRVDSGVSEGAEVSVYYDPMLAKLITWGRNRTESLARMEWALSRYVVLGVTTNISFLRAVIRHPDFIAGRLHTQFLEKNQIAPDEGDCHLGLMAAALALSKKGIPTKTLPSGSAASGPWNSGDWRAY